MEGYSRIDLDISNSDPELSVLEHMLLCSKIAARHWCWVVKYSEFGPAGGTPNVQIAGRDEDLWSLLTDPFTMCTQSITEMSRVMKEAWAEDIISYAETVFSHRVVGIDPKSNKFVIELGTTGARKNV